LTPSHHDADTHVRRAGSPSRAHGWCAGPWVESVQFLPSTTSIGEVREHVGARRGRNTGKVVDTRRQLEYVYYALRDHHVGGGAVATA